MVGQRVNIANPVVMGSNEIDTAALDRGQVSDAWVAEKLCTRIGLTFFHYHDP